MVADAKQSKTVFVGVSSICVALQQYVNATLLSKVTPIAPVVARVCRGDIALAVLGYPLETPDAEAEHKWPRPVLEALRARMVLEDIVPAGLDRRYVYARDDRRRCSGG